MSLHHHRQETLMTIATNTGSTGILEEPTASLFQASRAEVIIDRPPQDVWSVLTDLSFETVKSWNPDVENVKHISGAPRQENELVLVTKDKKIGRAPFYMRTIRMVPNQQRVLRVDDSDGSLAGFVDHSLYELAGKTTKVVYNGYFETRHIPADQVRAFDFTIASASMMNYLNHAFELLKDLVELGVTPPDYYI